MNEPTLDEFSAQLTERSNWGRWGADDQRGAINLIDDAKRQRAAGLVRTGHSVSLSRDFPKTPAPNNRRPANQFLLTGQRPHGGGYATDYVGLEFHGVTCTHIDALCHMWDHAGGWNGRDPKEFLRSDGATWGGIEHWRDGIVTRGVLLDIPRVRGVPYVDTDHPVQADDLRAAAQAQGVDLKPGDAVLVFSGREAYEAEQGVYGAGGPRPGLHASCLWFLRDTDCSVLAWDMVDAVPQVYDDHFPYTVHSCIFAYGLAVVDNVVLTELAAHCAAEGRYEFMFVVAPLPIVGGTGSPVNPLALF